MPPLTIKSTMVDRRWELLAKQSGQAWLSWFSRVDDKQSDLCRALDCLESLTSPIDVSIADVQKGIHARIKACHKFVGHSKCPSSSACDKIAFRIQILHGWFDSIDVSHEILHWHALQIIGGVLPRLFALCEGADDRRHVLIHAVRDLTRTWLAKIESAIAPEKDKLALLYPLAMQDQTGVITPSWWWRVLAIYQREALLELVQQDIDVMESLEPSTVARWKSYEGRWVRLRLKALLEHIGENWLLSELLAKSALDDFEAASALQALAKANRFREAIALGEKWHRIMPSNAVIGEELLALYLHDGWDEEAIGLLRSLYAFDPNPKWADALLTRFGICVESS